MKTILTFILSALLLPCFAQNMVVNGDFEDHQFNTIVGIDPQCYSGLNSQFPTLSSLWSF